LIIDSQHVEDEELPQQAAQGKHTDRGSMHSEEENNKEVEANVGEGPVQ
jgi:hypothetical protein